MSDDIKLEKNDFIEIYKTAISEEQYFLSEHHKRIAFYAGFLSSLFAGTIVGIFKANEIPDLILTLLGPIAIWIICYVGYKTSKSSYKRFLEAVTVKAKIERILNIDKEPVNNNYDNTNWLNNEQIVNSRHLESRKNGSFRTSGEWVDHQLYKKCSVNFNAKLLFVFASVLTLVPVSISIYKSHNISKQEKSLKCSNDKLNIYDSLKLKTNLKTNSGKYDSMTTIKSDSLNVNENPK